MFGVWGLGLVVGVGVGGWRGRDGESVGKADRKGGRLRERELGVQHLRCRAEKI